MWVHSTIYTWCRPVGLHGQSSDRKKCYDTILDVWNFIYYRRQMIIIPSSNFWQFEDILLSLLTQIIDWSITELNSWEIKWVNTIWQIEPVNYNQQSIIDLEQLRDKMSDHCKTTFTCHSNKCILLLNWWLYTIPFVAFSDYHLNDWMFYQASDVLPHSQPNCCFGGCFSQTSGYIFCTGVTSAMCVDSIKSPQLLQTKLWQTKSSGYFLLKRSRILC